MKEYNPKQQDRAFKSFRLTISDSVLIEAIEDIQRETGRSDSDILKESLLLYLQEQEKIELY